MLSYYIFWAVVHIHTLTYIYMSFNLGICHSATANSTTEAEREESNHQVKISYVLWSLFLLHNFGYLCTRQGGTAGWAPQLIARNLASKRPPENELWTNFLIPYLIPSSRNMCSKISSNIQDTSSWVRWREYIKTEMQYNRRRRMFGISRVMKLRMKESVGKGTTNTRQSH